jgi:hypothetical protein
LLEEGKQIGNWRWGQALVLLFQAPHSRAWNYPPYLIPTNCWVSQNQHQQQACALEQDMVSFFFFFFVFFPPSFSLLWSFVRRDFSLRRVGKKRVLWQIVAKLLFLLAGGEGFCVLLLAICWKSFLFVWLAVWIEEEPWLIISQFSWLYVQSPVNSLECDVALFRVCVTVIRGQVSSRDNKGKEEEIQELRTCRICKKPFQPVHNHPQACRYHTAHFGGGFGNSFFFLPWILSLVFLLAYLL